MLHNPLAVDADISHDKQLYASVTEILSTSQNQPTSKELLDKGNEAYANKQYNVALTFFQQAEEKGSLAATANIGMMYALGYGVTKDISKAKSQYEKAINGGNAFAMYRMGLLYFEEYKNDSIALTWFLQAAEKGNANAQEWAGYMYDNARGTTIDSYKAVEWFKKAITNGNKAAESRLGVAEKKIQDGSADYELGLVHYRKKDYLQSVSWLEKATQKGHLRATNLLGVMYNRGEGVKSDTAKAISLYRLAADADHVESMRNLGITLGHQGKHNEALEWYRKAADKGDLVAINNIGFAYGNGRGVALDYTEALKWYRMAAEKGHGMSQFNLAVMYADGQGVKKDLDEALKWAELAVASGYEPAKAELENIKKEKEKPAVTTSPPATTTTFLSDNENYKKGKVAYDAKNYVQALEWFKMAVKQDDVESMYMIGKMYDFGYGVIADLDEALYWYDMAAARGHKRAMEEIEEIYYWGW